MKRRIAGIIAGTLSAAIAITAGINYRAAYAVFRNLAARKLSLDEHAQWDGGRSYEKIPYAGDSVSQCLKCVKGTVLLTRLPPSVIRAVCPYEPKGVFLLFFVAHCWAAVEVPPEEYQGHSSGKKEEMSADCR